MNKQNKKKVVSFRLDSSNFSDLEIAAKREGTSASNYARAATIDRLMGHKALTEMLEEELRTIRVKQDSGTEEIQTKLSLLTECVLKMLADSGIGGMNRDQIESWISRKMPRPGRREH